MMRLRASCRDANKFGCRQDAVANEDIDPQNSSWHKLLRSTLESYIPTVVRHRRKTRITSPLCASRRNTYPLSYSAREISQEYVPGSVGVTLNQVAGLAREYHEASVGGYRRLNALVVPLSPSCCNWGGARFRWTPAWGRKPRRVGVPA